MKHDLTASVMEKIVDHEKRRIGRWVTIFLVAVLSLCMIVIYGIFMAYEESMTLGTWSMLSLFGEDREIIREYWQSVLLTIWAELPHELLVGIFIGLLLICVLFLWTRTRRRIIRKKIQGIHTYSRKESYEK